MSAAAQLMGTRVRRIDAPWEDLLAITLAGPELRGVLVIGIGPRARGVGLCDARPRGLPASAFVQALRRNLEGARLTGIDDLGALLRLELERGGESWTLELWLSGARGNALLRRADGTATHVLHRDQTAPEPGGARGALDRPIEALRARGDELVCARADGELSGLQHGMARATRARLKRLRRRLSAVEGDLQRAEEVPTLRARAGLLLSHLHALDAKATHATLTDFGADPPTEVELELEPGLGPRGQAEAWFRRARKLERGATVARERIALTQREIESLEALAARVDDAPDAQALAELRAELERAGVALPDDGAARPGRTPRARLPYREYLGAGGRRILVGRGPTDNDTLTLGHARPHDLWLHARGHAGAHVVVPLERNEACPPQLLGDAATLAAHFSKAAGQQQVDVIYTPRRYVRKPRKAAPGLVTVQREKVFRLELEPPRLQRLLASERQRA